MPLRSSTSPGCSPTRASGARGFPAEKTTWVAGFQSSQPLQSAAARLRPSMSACSGTQDAAVSVKFLLPVPHRARPCAGLTMRVLPPFELDHVQYGVDQCQMGEGLREVSKLLAGVRVDLLAVQIQFTCEGQQLGTELASSLVLTDLAERRHQPEGADRKAALLAGKSVVGFLDLVAQHQLVNGELVGNRQHGVSDDRVVGRQEAHQR